MAYTSSECLDKLRRQTPQLWLNPDYQPAAPTDDFTAATALARFERSRGLLARVFPELNAGGGKLHSPLMALKPGKHSPNSCIPQHTYIKRDDALPVAGSVKARGGFHEVLALAEACALEAGLITPESSLTLLAEPAARALFARHTIAVGSTGNLGLGIGLISKGLGFQAVVHMSQEAKAWKKERLRQHGITVVEHRGDYAAAVQAGRAEAAADPFIHFVDDEQSVDLFLGYAAAAEELAADLQAAGRPVDAAHPLFVYLPCGVGGAPGGILYGLKQLFGAHVHGFFAEPVAAPCMLLQLASQGDKTSVYDIGLTNITQADGLAVASASPLVAPLMQTLLSGVFTVTDDTLLADACNLETISGIYVEPSAVAGLRGPAWIMQSAGGKHYAQSQQLTQSMADATHVVWATGGSLVPETIREELRRAGRTVLATSTENNM